MDLNDAIGKHAEWKTKLRVAITKHEQLDDKTISKDNCCDLGKWLHGEAKSTYGQLASHGNCLKKHATFHLEAGKIAKTINEKKFTEADAMLGAGGAYSAASNEVGVAIMQLKKEAKL